MRHAKTMMRRCASARGYRRLLHSWQKCRDACARPCKILKWWRGRTLHTICSQRAVAVQGRFADVSETALQIPTLYFSAVSGAGFSQWLNEVTITMHCFICGPFFRLMFVASTSGDLWWYESIYVLPREFTWQLMLLWSSRYRKCHHHPVGRLQVHASYAIFNKA